MFKLLSFLLSVMVLSPLSVTPYSPSEDGPVVIKIKNGDIDDGGPRMPSAPPIQGIVMGSNIYLYFSSNLGDIDVTLEEYFDGIIMQTVVDGSLPTATVPFSGGLGVYIITFTLGSGDEYVGAFNIT